MPALYMKALSKLIASTCPDPTTGCEVGVWQGHLSKWLLSTYPKLTLYMVDSYRERTLDEWHDIQDKSDFTIKVSALLAMRSVHEFEDRRIFIIADSVVASRHVPDNFLDFAFIDGGHTYPDVSADCIHWYDKVKPGGVLAGHDYNSKHPGVMSAVDEFATNIGRDLTVMFGNVWALTKPPT